MIRPYRKHYAVAAILALLMLCCNISCIDNDYDLSDIDDTIGIGSDTLTLPDNNNTQGIMLEDVFDISYTNFVKIDDDGNYYVTVDDKSATTLNTSLSKIKAVDDAVHESQFSFTAEDLSFNSSKRVKRVKKDISAQVSGTIGVYELSFNDIPTSVVDIDYINTTASVRCTASFSDNFKKVVQNVAAAQFYLPEFMDVEKVTVDGNEYSLDENNSFTLYDLSPRKNTVVTIKVKGLDKTKSCSEGNQLTYVRGEGLYMRGELRVKGTVNAADVDLDNVNPSDVYTITGKTTIGTVTLNSAIGYFEPILDCDQLGKLNIGVLPSFLDDNNVVLDLSDLKIDLIVNSDYSMDLLAEGDLVAKKDEKEVCRISIPQFSIPAGLQGVLSFREQSSATGADTTVIQVPELRKLLREVPEEIVLTDMKVMGNPMQKCLFEMGHTYKMTANFSLRAPLAFGSEATIMYQHPYTNWNHVLKDVSFIPDENGKPNGYCLITTDVENTMPMYLTMSAYGLDENGDSISTERVNVEVTKQIPASPDGKTPVFVQQQIIIRPIDNAVFKELDGMMLKMAGSAIDENGNNVVEGKTLNNQRHTVILNKLKMQLVGKVAVDLN